MIAVRRSKVQTQRGVLAGKSPRPLVYKLVGELISTCFKKVGKEIAFGISYSLISISRIEDLIGNHMCLRERRQNHDLKWIKLGADSGSGKTREDKTYNRQTVVWDCCFFGSGRQRLRPAIRANSSQA
jgi:hypothetical protein